VPDFAARPWSQIVEIVAAQAPLIGQLLVIVVVAWAALRISSASIHRIARTVVERESASGPGRQLTDGEVRKRYETIDILATRLVRLLILLIAGATVLETFRISVAPAIAGFGIVGIAVGFGAQHLVRDYVNGALILVENQFSKGDVVQIAGVTGAVEDFTLRRTTLRDLDGRVHNVPNSAIVVASNLTRAWARINLDLTVSHEADLDLVARVVERVGREMASDPTWEHRVLEAPRVDRVEAVTDAGVTLKILGTVLAADRWAGAGEVRRRLYLALGEAGIGLPGRPGAATGPPLGAIRMGVSPEPEAPAGSEP
jgi:small conductance mechanosensitive channel